MTGRRKWPFTELWKIRLLDEITKAVKVDEEEKWTTG